MDDESLSDTCVLVTRPEKQAIELADAIGARGGEAIVFPCLDIVARHRDEIRRDAAALAPADITVFISRNAVDFGHEYADGLVAAIGPTTAAALESTGTSVDIVPDAGFDTEHLLAAPAFADVAGKRIRIVRGSEGREMLAESLRAGGADVDYLPVYERRLPTYSAAEIEAVTRRADNIDAIIVLSVATLNNLERLLPDATLQRLSASRLVSAAPRVIKEALQRNPDRPTTLAAGPRLSDLLEAVGTNQDTASASCESCSSLPTSVWDASSRATAR